MHKTTHRPRMGSNRRKSVEIGSILALTNPPNGGKGGKGVSKSGGKGQEAEKRASSKKDTRRHADMSDGEGH